jgi:hypothetical protein
LRFVRLRPRRLYGRAFSGIQASELNAALINRTTHLSTKGINLAHKMSLADAADRWIAGHLADVVQIDRENQGAAAQTGSSQSGFDTGVTSTNYDNVKASVHNLSAPSAPKAQRLHEFSDRV